MGNLHDKKKAATNIDIMKSGMEQAFWKLIMEALDENIVVAEDELRDEARQAHKMRPDDYRFWSENLKDQIDLFKLLKRTPELIIGNLEEGKGGPIDFDPYDKMKPGGR